MPASQSFTRRAFSNTSRFNAQALVSPPVLRVSPITVMVQPVVSREKVQVSFIPRERVV